MQCALLLIIWHFPFEFPKKISPAQCALDFSDRLVSLSCALMASSHERPSVDLYQGIQYFWDAVKVQAKNRHEAALALLHWILVGHGYRCIGRDNEVCFAFFASKRYVMWFFVCLQFPAKKDDAKLGSERLPEGWNDRSAGFYSLLYVHPNRPANMYLIKLIPAGNANDGAIVGQVLVGELLREYFCLVMLGLMDMVDWLIVLSWQQWKVLWIDW